MTDHDPKADAKRQAALQGALTQIERQFGKGTVMRMGDPGARVAVDAIPTGALSLDIALGIGGVPRGRIIEIFGPESSGKTTLVYHILAEAQKLGGVCAFVDAEHAMDPIYAQTIGVDIDELLVSQPDFGEQALEIVDMLIRSGAVDVIAVDSVAALTPRAELEGQMGDQSVGLQARMMSQAMRKLTSNLNRTQTLCVFTNQIREKIGVMFGSPETQPGGRALKFYASQRLDIRRIETLKDGTEAVGNRVRVKVVKNKVAAPFKQAEFDIEFGRGISTSGCLIDYGIEHNIVTKSGSFFSYGEERLGQGRGNAKAFLDEHQDMAKEIQAKVYAALDVGRDLVKPIVPRDDEAAPTDDDLAGATNGAGAVQDVEAITGKAAGHTGCFPQNTCRRATAANSRTTVRARAGGRPQVSEPPRPDRPRGARPTRAGGGRRTDCRRGDRNAGRTAVARRCPVRAALHAGQADTRTVGRRQDRACSASAGDRRSARP
jgi:recombination protein RecA